MLRIALLVVFCALTIGAGAGEPEYSPAIATWEEVIPPAEQARVDRMLWFHSANSSSLEWEVFLEGGEPSAAPVSRRASKQNGLPPFTPKVLGHGAATSAIAVADGWLVAFNDGEFGASLYWFSKFGDRRYKISDDQVVDFVLLPTGVHAIAGLAHLGMSSGSVIRIARTIPSARWVATTVATLPFAPYAVAVRRDASMLITLSDALVSLDRNYAMRTLLYSVPWQGLYPNSSILSSSEQRLYIGMRQFVGEYDLSTNKFRLLIPTIKLLTTLPEQQIKQIRKIYGQEKR